MKKILLALIVAAVPAFGLQANICDDIHHLANDWHDLANTIHEIGADNITPAEWNSAKPRIDALDADTEKVIGLCASVGNAEQKKLGKNLGGVYKALDSATANNVVGKIDAVVKVLDQVVHSCDNN